MAVHQSHVHSTGQSSVDVVAFGRLGGPFPAMSRNNDAADARWVPRSPLSVQISQGSVIERRKIGLDRPKIRPNPVRQNRGQARFADIGFLAVLEQNFVGRGNSGVAGDITIISVSYTHLRAHETGRNLVCRLLLEKKKK